jgi:microcystin-dependent protein
MPRPRDWEGGGLPWTGITLPSSTPSPKIVNALSPASLNGIVQSGDAISVLYGRRKIQGKILIGSGTIQDTNVAHFIVMWCGGPVGRVNRIYVSGVDINMLAQVVADNHLGAADQPQDSWLKAKYGAGVTRMPGVCYSHITVVTPGSQRAWKDALPGGGATITFEADINGLTLDDLSGSLENRIPNSEVYSGSGWTSDYTPPTVTTGYADPLGGTNAGRLAFGVAGANDWYRGLGLAVSPGDVFQANVWFRAPSGSYAAQLRATKIGGSGYEADVQNITIDGTWRRFSTVHTVIGAGTSIYLILYFLSGTPTVEIFGAQIQLRAADYGYVKTTVAQIIPTYTPTKVWSDNAALVQRDMIINPPYGGGFPVALLNDADNSLAAQKCDEPVDGVRRYTMSPIILEKGSLEGYIEMFRAMCAAKVIFAGGLLSIVVAAPRSGPVLALTENVNIRDLKVSRATNDRTANCVDVHFTNAAKGYAADIAPYVDPAVTTGALSRVEARYEFDGVTVEKQAYRLARYYGRLGMADLLAHGTASAAAAILAQEDLVTLTTDDGLVAQQMLVTELAGDNPNGDIVLDLVEYDPAVTSDDATVTDTPPSVAPPMPTPDSQRFYRIPGSGGDFGLMMRRGDAYFAIWQGAFFGRWVTFDDAQTYGDPSADRSVALRPTQAPAKSIPGEGKVVFDNALKKFVASEDGKAFSPLLSGTVPVGGVIPYTGATAPASWLMCDGAAYSTTSKGALFAVIGYVYGGSGTTFNVPDFRQRFPLGKATSGTGSTLGGVGGAIDHVHGMDHAHFTDDLVSSDIPTGIGDVALAGTTAPPDIPVARAAHIHNVQIFSATDLASVDRGTPNTDVENPPFQTVNFIIKY